MNKKEKYLFLKVSYLVSGGCFMLFCITKTLYLENGMYPYIAPLIAVCCLILGVICEASIEAEK